MAENKHRLSLNVGHMIGPYEIIDSLGQGGFGITYLAMDTNLNRKVAIKEFLPVEMAVRDTDTCVYPVSGQYEENFNWGLERFISEAQTLAQFNHPNIIRVLTVLRENNTAYIVMEYEYGQPLSELLRGKKTLDEGQSKNLLIPIMDGLELIHRTGFIHRDIKPPNIYIREDNSPVLIDFGSARQSMLQHTRTLTTLVSPGYAPFEQYTGKSDKQGPWTDIYGLGATLYRAVTGLSPVDSMQRSEALLHTGKDIYVNAAEIAEGKYSPAFLAAIDRAMAFRIEDRPQSIAEWRNILDGNTSEAITDIAESETATVEMETRTVKIDPSPAVHNNSPDGPLDKLNRVIWKTVLVGIVLVAVLFIVRVILPGDNKDSPRPQSVQEGNPAVTPETEVVDTQTTEGTTSPVEEIKQPLLKAADNDTVTGNTGSINQDRNRTDNVTTAPESTANDRQVSDLGQTISRIPLADRRRLRSIRDRLDANRRDREARRDLDNLANEFQDRIVASLRSGDYDLAREYVSEIQKHSDKDTEAYRRLEALMENINRMEREADKTGR